MKSIGGYFVWGHFVLFRTAQINKCNRLGDEKKTMMKSIFVVFLSLCIALSACSSKNMTPTATSHVVKSESSKKTISIPPTASPTTSPSIMDTPMVVAKVIGNTNLRTGPNLKYPSLEILFPGELVKVLYRSSDSTWLFVISAVGNKGWLNANYVKSLTNFENLSISEDILLTATISPTPVKTPTITKTPKITATSTLRPTTTMQPTSLQIPNSVSDAEYVNFLMDEYNKYHEIYTRMTNSPGAGEDVKSAYFASLKIADEVSRKQVPAYMSDLKNDLENGIRLQAQGFGCYSNKTLCNGGVEATSFLYNGRVLLDKFLNDVNEKYR